MIPVALPRWASGTLAVVNDLHRVIIIR